MPTAPRPQPAVQDPVKVDPKHYKAELGNDRVRVLRITYGPREKSVMHSHPDGIAVLLTNQHSRFTLPDGKSEENRFIPGQTMWPGAICPRTWPTNRLRSSWSS
jgi:hypothetical protein